MSAFADTMKAKFRRNIIQQDLSLIRRQPHTGYGIPYFSNEHQLRWSFNPLEHVFRRLVG